MYYVYLYIHTEEIIPTMFLVYKYDPVRGSCEKSLSVSWKVSCQSNLRWIRFLCFISTYKVSSENLSRTHVIVVNSLATISPVDTNATTEWTVTSQPISKHVFTLLKVTVLMPLIISKKERKGIDAIYSYFILFYFCFIESGMQCYLSGPKSL